MANIATLGYADPDPDVEDEEWIATPFIGLTSQNQGTFVNEGTHNELTIGQIWPR